MWVGLRIKLLIFLGFIYYRISVKNEFLDEKEDVCILFGELVGNIG